MKAKTYKSYIKSLGLILVILLIPPHVFAQKVTKLLEKGQYEKAEQYCAKLKGGDQKSCYKVLADTYFEKAGKGKDGYEKVTDAYSGAQLATDIIPDIPKELNLLFILKDNEPGKIILEYFGDTILTL